MISQIVFTFLPYKINDNLFIFITMIDCLKNSGYQRNLKDQC